ncbi:hypothetical protein EVAR_30564_1 [Eumeta japonica]|uniref:Uncharacterized protein n=1 Tax=Eumeta variegata TaxID=151549 RepID=A0A4C1VRR9_EUMVA|nr:hypothetical protein EVAR_30564_1 [Eumeta japonica]
MGRFDLCNTTLPQNAGIKQQISLLLFVQLLRVAVAQCLSITPQPHSISPSPLHQAPPATFRYHIANLCLYPTSRQHTAEAVPEMEVEPESNPTLEPDAKSGAGPLSGPKLTTEWIKMKTVHVHGRDREHM